MFFSDLVAPSYSMYEQRRESLVQNIRQDNSEIKKGLILLFADFDKGDSVSFEQESTFFYLSGLREPGLVMAIEFDSEDTKLSSKPVIKSRLFVPNCVEERKKWLGSAIEANKKDAELFYFNEIDFLGDKLSGLNLDRYFDKQVYKNILDLISNAIKSGTKICVLNSKDNAKYFDQLFILDRLKSLVPEISTSEFVDISGSVIKMRRKKDLFEIGKISEAIGLTALSHESGARSILVDGTECEVQAAIEFVFTAVGAKRAYCSIVAGGDNATTLHYNENCDQLGAGDLLIVDAGAKLDGYCADITRTYPVSGSFTARQKEVYDIVLACQKYIESIAKPGYYLKNFEQKDKCLTCLATEFFKQHGLDEYFIHGIGHFLGLDVHDVGILKSPIQEGDVITIEPGIYIKKESIGIRIEDDYWVTKNGVVCLSDMIPKSADDICDFMKNGLQDEQEEK